jgi:23S rRNA pseudouridine955/2504/2580 synthase
LENVIHQNIKHVSVDNETSGQRIDNFLFKTLKGVPKSLIYRIIRKGEVRVNKKRIDPDYRLQANDLIRLPPMRVSEDLTKIPKKQIPIALDAIRLYEDENILLINKPAQLSVHGGSFVHAGLIESLRAQYPQYPFLELVHRLDKDTSGCLMIAKNRLSLTMLHELLRSGDVKKTYQLLVMGHWDEDKQLVEMRLLKNRLQSGERMVKMADEGKLARTRFKVLERFSSSTLLQAELLTGRTHQIRAHTAYSGHPIAGDDKYGNREYNKQMRTHGLKRMFLHAYSIRLVLPDSKKIIEVTAKLPEDLLKVLKKEGSL